MLWSESCDIFVSYVIKVDIYIVNITLEFSTESCTYGCQFNSWEVCESICCKSFTSINSFENKCAAEKRPSWLINWLILGVLQLQTNICDSKETFLGSLIKNIWGEECPKCVKLLYEDLWRLLPSKRECLSSSLPSK